MADKFVPPASNNVARGGKVVEKPKDMKGTLTRLISLTKGHRKGLFPVMILAGLASLSAIVSPYVSGEAVTAISNSQPVTFILVLLALLYFGDWFIRYLQAYLMAKCSQGIVHYIRLTLFDKIKHLPLSFFDKRQHGELMSRLTNDVDNISTTISSSLSMLLTYVFQIVGIFVMMLLLSPLLTAVSLVGVAMIFALTKVITSRTSKLFKDRQVKLGILNGQIEESISGLHIVKAFSREEKLIKEFEEKNDALCKTSIKALIWSGYLMPLMNVINNFSYLIIAVVSGIMFINGSITDIGLISSFLLYIRQFNRPFVDIANIFNNFQTAVAGAERIFEIFDEEEEPADKPGALSLREPKGSISMRHVDFGYNEEKLVLKDICLDIPAGTKVAIVGPTGSGKTTIINLLTRFYDVTGGTILLDGHDLRDYKMEDLRFAYGVVLQDTALFEATVRENICYGHDEASTDDVIAAAKAAGADSFIRRLKNGYDTFLANGGTELSQGERQLLTIARAILTDAPIMILDEATSSVDTVTEQKIRRAMLNICEGRTSFIIAHRLSTIRDSDVIIVIEDGRIVEKGTHDELLAHGGSYSTMYRTQTGEI